MSECEVEDFSIDYILGDSLGDNKPQLPTICLQCQKEFTEPVVLNCLHVFDRNCLLSFENTDGIFPIVSCPKCGMQSGSLSSLQSYYSQYALESNETSANNGNGKKDVNEFKCVLCTSGEEAKYKCTDCAGLLCERCKTLHKEVKFLSSHLEVTELTEDDKDEISALKKYLAVNKPVKCDTHPERKFNSYCIQCGMIACTLCVNVDHVDHSTTLLEEFPKKISVTMNRYIDNCKSAEASNKISIDRLSSLLIDVNNSLDENKTHIEEVCNEWKNAIDEVKSQFLHRNKTLHNELELKVMNSLNKSEELQEHIEYCLEFTRSYLDRCSNVEYCKIIKTVLECLRDLADKHIDTDLNTNISFKENNSSIVNIIQSNFGVFINSDDFSSKKCSSEDSGNLEVAELANCIGSLNAGGDSMAYKSSSLVGGNLQNINSSTNNHFIKAQVIMQNGTGKHFSEPHSLSPSTPYQILPMNSPMDILGSCNQNDIGFNFPSFENRFEDSQSSVMGMLPPTTHTSPLSFPTIDTFSSSGSNGFLRTNASGPNTVTSGGGPGSTTGLSSVGTAGFNPNNRPPFPNRGNQCSVMTVKARWGSLGSGCGEMSSPHGFCLGFQEEIVVADTQNHRIQIFNKEGQFLSQFGVAGRDEGQLWFPRKVAILRSTQRYVVCDRGNERSRMQIFGRSGHFLRKISIRYIDIVAGLAVNSMGHIVAVDSVSPSVFVVSEAGELIKWFDCSSCMREPSDIAVHGEEYYICDFKGHCVCVFKQDGAFVQRFGNETITNFPNGIDVSDHGDILVGDSHGNRFHIAIYSRDGKLMSEFECPSVKVSRACGLKITSEGYLVTLAKNNHHLLVMDTLYIS